MVGTTIHMIDGQQFGVMNMTPGARATPAISSDSCRSQFSTLGTLLSSLLVAMFFIVAQIDSGLSSTPFLRVR
jgi:hypothetical protein